MAVDDGAPKDPRGKIISQFKIFWNDAAPKKVVVLQFPDRKRDHPYNHESGLQPLELRMKPKTGLVEIDVPLNTQAKGHFNKERAVEFGEQLARHRTRTQGGQFGLAGGFGVGGVNRGNRGAAVAAKDEKHLSMDIDEAFDQAARQGKVLDRLTLAGKIQQFKDGDPIYAMATFKKDEIHLTRVSAICSLSPQYGHLDAATDNEKASRMRDAEPGAAEPEARAINVSVKTGDADSSTPNDIGKTLRALQEEPWQKLEWVDEEEDVSFKAFQDHVFYKDTDTNIHLVSAMTPLTYLEAISAPKVEDKVVGQRIREKNRQEIADLWDESTDEEETDEEVMQEEGQRRQIAVDG